MPDTRLIERWLPIAALGEESVRERRSMTALPPTYYLHVWWARRPLVAARAAVLASLLPADADRDQFLHVLGIHGDPVATRRRIDAAKRNRENLGSNPYGYKRAFSPGQMIKTRTGSSSSLQDIGEVLSVLDPTAGGGKYSHRNRAAWIHLDCERPESSRRSHSQGYRRMACETRIHGGRAVSSVGIRREFIRRAEPHYKGIFPAEPEGVQITGYLWARTITCPYCEGRVPLSPNWRLAPDGTGVRLKPELGSGPGSDGRICAFEIVTSATEQSDGTVSNGDGTCPYPDCGRVIDGDAIKRQAQAGQMGEQLFAVVYKTRVEKRLKSGKRGKDRWVRGYRAPRPEDDNSTEIQARLAEKLPEWEALDLVPSEVIPDGNKTTEPSTLWHEYLARSVFPAPVVVSRHERGNLPGNARRRPGSG